MLCKSSEEGSLYLSFDACLKLYRFKEAGNQYGNRDPFLSTFTLNSADAKNFVTTVDDQYASTGNNIELNKNNS